MKKIERTVDNILTKAVYGLNEFNLDVKWGQEFRNIDTTLRTLVKKERPPFVIVLKLYDIVLSYSSRLYHKYPRDSKGRRFYKSFVLNCFTYVNAIPLKRTNYVEILRFDNEIEIEMNKAEARAIVLQRWSKVKYMIVRLEYNAKVQACVDRWLINNDLAWMLDAKCKVAAIKRALRPSDR